MFEQKNVVQLNWNRSDKDYVKGINSPIPYQIVLPTNDWRPYVRDNEKQKLQFDTNGCSEYSPMVSCVESQLNYLMAEGLLSKDALNFFTTNGYIVDGQFQCSVEFSATLAGTTINGNSPANFAYSVKNNGLIPEYMLQMTLADSMQYPTQEAQDSAFYDVTRITPAMRALGKQSLAYFSIAYQWIGNTDGSNNTLATIQHALYQAPLVYGLDVGTSDLTNWNGGMVKWLGGKLLEHCVGGIFVDPNNTTFPFYIHDNYNPFVKQLASDYWISQILQIIVTAVAPLPPVQAPTPVLAGFNITKPLKLWSVGQQVYLLQNRLVQGGFASFTPTGFFGFKTEDALIHYQTKNGLPQSGYCDILTLTHLQQYG